MFVCLDCLALPRFIHNLLVDFSNRICIARIHLSTFGFLTISRSHSQWRVTIVHSGFRLSSSLVLLQLRGCLLWIVLTRDAFGMFHFQRFSLSVSTQLIVWYRRVPLSQLLEFQSEITSVLLNTLVTLFQGHTFVWGLLFNLSTSCLSLQLLHHFELSLQWFL